MDLTTNPIFTGFMPYLIIILFFGFIIGFSLWYGQRKWYDRVLGEIADKRNGKIEKFPLSVYRLTFPYKDYKVSFIPRNGLRGIYTSIKVFILPCTADFYTKSSGLLNKKLVIKSDDVSFSNKIFNPNIKSKFLSLLKKHLFGISLKNGELVISINEPLFDMLKPEKYEQLIDITLELVDRIEEATNDKS